MQSLTALATGTAHPLTLTLLHFLWQGALIAMFTGFALRVVRRRSSRLRYLIATLGLVAQSLAPLMTYLVLSDPSVVGPPAGSAEPLVTLTEVSISPLAGGVPDEGTGTATTTGSLRLSSFAGRWQPHLLAMWLCGVSLLSLRLLISTFYVQGLRWRTELVPVRLSDRIETIALRLGTRCRGRVRGSSRIGEALVVGCWKPLVILPTAWIAELPPEVLEAIVAHELAHIRRWDLWINLWQRVIETLLFYHPAVWWLSRRVRLEREMCCDELAVSATGERVVYANALRMAAGRRVASTRPALAAALKGESRMSVLRRVRNVLGVGQVEQPTGWWQIVLLAMLIPTVAVSAPLLLQSLTTPALADDDDRDTDRRDRDRNFERERSTDRDRDREPRREQRERRKRVEFDRPNDRDRPADGDRRRDSDPPPRRERGRHSDHDNRPGPRFVPPAFDGGPSPSFRRPLAPRDADRNERRPLDREDRLLQLIIELKQEVAGLREEVRNLKERQPEGPRRQFFQSMREFQEEANRQGAEAQRRRAMEQWEQQQAETTRHRDRDRAAAERQRAAAQELGRRRQIEAEQYRDADRDEAERRRAAAEQSDRQLKRRRQSEAERRHHEDGADVGRARDGVKKSDPQPVTVRKQPNAAGHREADREQAERRPPVAAKRDRPVESWKPSDTLRRSEVELGERVFRYELRFPKKASSPKNRPRPEPEDSEEDELRANPKTDQIHESTSPLTPEADSPSDAKAEDAEP